MKKKAKNLTIKQQKPPPHAMNNTDNNLRQTYLKDCDCTNGGIIIHDGEAVCRWCLTPYAEGGCISYPDERFPQSKLKEQQPISNDRVEVTTCGHANWNEPNGGAFIFKTNKPIRYNDFPAEKVKSAIEQAINGKEEDYLKSSLGTHHISTKDFEEKYGIGISVPSTQQKYYSQSEVDTIRRKAFEAANKIDYAAKPIGEFYSLDTLARKGNCQIQYPKKYPTIEDYLNSLSAPTTQPKEEDKPVLFITEDGVEIRNGDHAFYVQDDNNWMVVSHSGITEKRPYPYFHTSESANKWVLENKPCLSLNEVKELANNNGAKVLCIPDEKISNYTKQKLNQQ